MSENIENRIVRMEFDNERFEKNTKKTMSTLDKLKAKLDFSGVNKSIDETSESLDNIDTKKAEKSVGLLSKGYAALKVAAVSAIATMSATFTQALMQNKQLLSKMTQMKNGWEEYAVKTQSVQTILTALNDTYGTQAEKMELVTEKIEQLKWFADETSYSLRGMTGALSKFLSAGVGLDESVNAVQGISVWAAMEGQGKQAAEHISTQMAQALGRNLMAQDWSSIETMNMGSETFKTELLKMAALDKESGVLEKDGKFYFGGLTESVSMYGLRLTDTAKSLEEMNAENEITMANFRAFLSKGIISGATLSKVFDKYGEFATELNNVNNAIGELDGEAPILMKWRKFFDIFDNTDNMKEFFDQVNQNDDLAGVFKDTTLSMEDFYAVMERLGSEEFSFSREGTFLAYEAKTFQEAIEATATGMSTQFSNIFEAIFGNYMQAREIFSNFAEWLYTLYIEPLSDLADDFADALATPEGELNPILQAFANIGNAIMDVVEAWRGAKEEIFGGEDENGTRKRVKTIQTLANAFASLTKKISDFTKNNKTKLQNIFAGVLKVCQVLVKVLKILAGVVWDVIVGIVDLLGGLFEAINEVFTDKKSEDGLEDKANTADKFAGALDTIKTALQTVGKWFKDVIQYIKDSEILNKIVMALAEVFVWLVDKAKEFYAWGKDIGLWEKLATVLKWVGEGIANIVAGLANLITGKASLGDLFSGKAFDIGTKAKSAVDDVKESIEELQNVEEDAVDKTEEMSKAYEDFLYGLSKATGPITTFEEDAARAAGMTEKEIENAYKAIQKYNAELNQNTYPYHANGMSATLGMMSNVSSGYQLSLLGHPSDRGASSSGLQQQANQTAGAITNVANAAQTASEETLTFGNVMVVLAIAFARVTDMFLNPRFIFSLAVSIFALALAIGTLKKSLLSGNHFSLFSFGSISKSVEGVSAVGALAGLAALIGVVAGAIWLLSTVDISKLEAMTPILIGMGVFIILIISELIYLENVVKGKSTSHIFAKAGGGKIGARATKSGIDSSDWLFATLLSIAGIIAACALIVWALSGVDYNNFGKFEGALLTIGAFVVVILLEVVWLEKVMKQDSKDIDIDPKSNIADILSSSLFAVALLMFAIASVMKILAGMEPDKMWAMLPVLGIIFAFVFALVLALIIFCEKITSSEKKIDKKMTSAFKSGEVIGLLFAAVGAIGLIMTAVAALVLIIATNPHLLAPVFANSFMKIMGTIAVFILILAAIMLGIIESFKRMPATGSNFDPANMYKLILNYCIGLSAIILAVAGLAATVGTFGLNPNFLENLAATMGLIGLLMIIFAVAVQRLRKSKASSTKDLIGMMMSFASALAIIVTAFAVALALMPNSDGLITKAIVLGSLITILGAGLFLVSKYGDIKQKDLITYTACLVALTTGFVIIGAAMRLMGDNNLITKAIILGALITILGAGLFAVAKFGKLDSKKVIVFAACVVALSLGMLAIAGAIKALDGMSVNSIVAIGIALGALLALMSGIVYLGQNLQGMAALWAAIFTVLLWIVSVALLNLAKAVAISLPPIMDALQQCIDIVESGGFGALLKGIGALTIALLLLVGAVPLMLILSVGIGALALSLLPLGAAIWLAVWPLVKLMELMGNLGDIDFSETTKKFKAFLDGIAGMVEACIVTLTRLGVMLGTSVLIGLLEGTVEALDKINNSGLLSALATSLASTVMNLLDAFVPLLSDVFEWTYYKIMATEWGPLGLLLLTAGIPFLSEKVMFDALRKGGGVDYSKKADRIKDSMNIKAKAAMEEYKASQEDSGGGFLGGLFDGANGDTLTDILIDVLDQVGATDFLKNQGNSAGLNNVETDLIAIEGLRSDIGGQNNQQRVEVSYGGNTYYINVEGHMTEEEIEEMTAQIIKSFDEQTAEKAQEKAQGAGIQTFTHKGNGQWNIPANGGVQQSPVRVAKHGFSGGTF